MRLSANAKLISSLPQLRRKLKHSITKLLSSWLSPIHPMQLALYKLQVFACFYILFLFFIFLQLTLIYFESQIFIQADDMLFIYIGQDNKSNRRGIKLVLPIYTAILSLLGKYNSFKYYCCVTVNYLNFFMSNSTGYIWLV